jgi:hypothetical protein
MSNVSLVTRQPSLITVFVVFSYPALPLECNGKVISDESI